MTALGRLYASLPGPLARAVPVELRYDLRARLEAWAPGDLGFVPDPPPAGPDETTGPPDFLVLGPVESGARWWLSHVADLAAVAPTRDPDGAAHVFDRGCTEDLDADGWARFDALFPRRPGRIVGHWSADGLSYPWIAPLLARAAPEARVLVLVRDPVDLVADRVAATSGTRAPHGGSNLADAVDRGFAGSQVARLREVFPPEAVRVLQYERCVADGAGALSATAAFLDVAAPTAAFLPRPADGVTPSAGALLDPTARARLRALYAADVDRLAGLVPDLDLDLWTTFAGPG